MTDIKIILQDGAEFCGKPFGYCRPAAGQAVFTTAMTGYPESLTDPANYGNILVMTWPLAGNYGVPSGETENGLLRNFESDRIHVSALVVTDYTADYSHWAATRSLADWMQEHRIPGMYGVDTRALATYLRTHGAMPAQIICDGQKPDARNSENPVEKVSCTNKTVYGNGSRRVLLVDCGVKHSTIRTLLACGLTVVRVPWNYDFSNEEYHGIFISSGPGDPTCCHATVQNIARALQSNRPVMGVGIGALIMALAAGANTCKLPCGHHGSNQPVKQLNGDTAFITTQNHIYTVDADTLPSEWTPWYVNLNDGSCEGFRHAAKPFFATLFTPESPDEATQTEYMFAQFVASI